MRIPVAASARSRLSAAAECRLLCPKLLSAWVIGSVLLAGGPTQGRAAAAEFSFSVRTSPNVRHSVWSGRVYLFFTREEQGEPRFGPNWFHPEPMLSRKVENWPVSEAIELRLDDPDVERFPKDLKERDFEGMRAQAVVRLNRWEREIGTGPGNAYSGVVAVRPGYVHFFVDHVVPEPSFQESEWAKLLTVRSEKLSRFHGREVMMKSTVRLPRSYQSHPARRYPVILEVPGFGGTHLRADFNNRPEERNTLGVEFIRVLLDPSCRWGHHAFANSETNGPWGDALIEEFLPALDAAFRTTGDASGRFLTGHSSGGWSTLWLQVAYPDQFGGTWSTAPDPVDFRDFQQINLYRDRNMFVDAQGERRPIARRNGEPVLYYDSFSVMEDVLGPGGQLRSFEAVFSHRAADGTPARLWNRDTGAIDHDVAESWKRYDIRHILNSRWRELQPRLSGKLHVFMGTEDTFYLDGATELLKEALTGLGSDAEIVMLPGRDHFDLFADGLRQRIEQEVASQFRQNSIGSLQNAN